MIVIALISLPPFRAYGSQKLAQQAHAVSKMHIRHIDRPLYKPHGLDDIISQYHRIYLEKATTTTITTATTNFTHLFSYSATSLPN